MSSAVRIQALVSFHQPVGASQATIASAVSSCYVPLLDALAKYPRARLGLHLGGHLLDYLARHDEALLLRLRKMAQAGQVEILGGMFYGPAPALIPEVDARGQAQMSCEFWESVLGEAPRGFFLPELGWSTDTPRLLASTPFEYGFVSDSQVKTLSGQVGAFGLVERGGQRCPVFVCDAALSSALPTRPVGEWIDALIDKGSRNAHRLVTTWVRAESLGLEPGTRSWCYDDGWLEEWLEALGQTDNLESALPATTFDQLYGGQLLRLQEGCAPEVGAYGLSAEGVDWADFPTYFTEVETLHRRMLRASDKLREAIGIMEDEELEDSWSDHLATAQRHIFKAQAHDAYHRAVAPGFGSPSNRDATMAEIAKAETIVDGLVQGEDDFLATEEEDRDGDLSAEVFVSNRHTTLWAVPARGAAVRTFDNRAARRNVLDVGTRRNEPFFAAMAAAKPATAGDELQHWGRRGEALPRLDGDLPTEADTRDRMGLQHLLLEESTSAEEFFSGSALNLGPAPGTWEVEENAIDEEGDCSYSLRVSNVHEVAGLRPRTVTAKQQLQVPIDSAQLTIHNDLRLEGGPPLLWATEIPVRLAAGDAVTIRADGRTIAPTTPQELGAVRSLRFEGSDGEAVEVRCEPALDMWLAPVRTAVKTVEGYRSMHLGFVAVPVIRLHGEVQASISVELGSK